MKIHDDPLDRYEPLDIYPINDELGDVTACIADKCNNWAEKGRFLCKDCIENGPPKNRKSPSQP